MGMQLSILHGECSNQLGKLITAPPTRRRKDNHPGWALLPLTTGHMPPYSEGGKPGSQTSSFTFTVRMGPSPAVPASSAGGAPLSSRSPRGSAPSPAPAGMPPGPGMLPGGVNGFGGPGPVPAGLPPMGMGGLGGLGGLGMPPPQQQLPPGFVPGSGLGGGLDGMRGMQQPGLGPLGGPGPMPGLPGLPPDLMYGQQQAAQPPRSGQQQQFGDGMPGINLDPATIQGLMQMPTLDLFGPGGPGGASAPPSGGAAAAAAGGAGGPAPMRGLGGNLPPELANLLKDDSLSPFEDPNFQQLMSMVAATQPPGAGEAGAQPGAPHSGRGPAPTSSERRAREKAAKRKAGGRRADVGGTTRSLLVVSRCVGMERPPWAPERQPHPHTHPAAGLLPLRPQTPRWRRGWT